MSHLKGLIKEMESCPSTHYAQKKVSKEMIVKEIKRLEKEYPNVTKIEPCFLQYLQKLTRGYSTHFDEKDILKQ